MKALLKTTIVGGILFLLPLAVLLFILGHALHLAGKIAQPIVDTLGIERLGYWSGIGAVTATAVLVLILVSFFAGLVARTTPGARIRRWFENSLLGSLPQYQFVKSMAEGYAQIESAEGLKPALVNVEEGWQIGYALEALDNGWVAVFLPQAPTPMSGNVMYFPAERVRFLNITMIEAMTLVKRMGVGSAEVLRGADLRPPQGA